MTRKEEKYAKELEKCLGKWVATVDSKVIAYGETLQEVQEKAKTLKVAKPVIFPLPNVRRGHSFF